MGQSNRSGVTFGWHAPEHFGRSPHEGRATALSGMGGRSNHVRLEVPPVVYNQHSVGRCVAEALAFCAELLAARAGYRRERPDRTSLYWRIRSAIGTTGEDSGGTIADGVAALRGGWEPELAEPSPVFDASYVRAPERLPPDAPRVVSAEPLAHDLATVAWELECGHPVAVGLRTTAQWQTLLGGTSDRLPPPDGDVEAGHAVALVGFQRDATGLEFRVRNSWGAGWGDGGEAWLPAEWLSLLWCGELYALRAVRRAAPPPSGVP